MSDHVDWSTNTRKRPLSLLALGLLAACAVETAPSARTTVRDSAGITIVENGAPLWGDSARWTISEAVLSIGSEDGADQLFRVSDATRLPDGRIAVANSGTGEIKIFGSTPEVLATVGRQGSGPGEFDLLRDLHRHGDGLAAFDVRQRRITIFSTTGAVDSLVTLPELTLIGPSLLTGGNQGWLISGPDRQRMSRRPSGYSRDTLEIVRFRPEENAVRPVISLPGEEVFAIRDEAGRSSRGFSAHLPLGHVGVVTADQSRIIAGNTAESELRAFDWNGALQMIIRLPWSNERVSKGDIRDAEQSYLGGPGGQWREERERILASAPAPELLPAYQQIVLDADGNLWVQRFGGNRWAVFDETGRFRGLLTLPDGKLLEIGSDYLLLSRTDEMGVEYLAVYDIVKPPKDVG